MRCKKCNKKFAVEQTASDATDGGSVFTVRAAGATQAKGSESTPSRRIMDWVVGAAAAAVIVTGIFWFRRDVATEEPAADAVASTNVVEPAEPVTVTDSESSPNGDAETPANSDSGPSESSDSKSAENADEQPAENAESEAADDVEQQTPADPEPHSGEELAAHVDAILKTNCYRCHGEGGSNEGGFNFVLNRPKLVADGEYISTGNPDESLLYKRMARGEMPPDGETPRPSEDDVETVRLWIEQGAPDFAAPLARDFVDDDTIFRSIADDLQSHANERDVGYFRYFTLTHLYNAGFSDGELETYRLALGKLLNSLSWRRSIIQPKPIDSPINTIYRIDLRDLDWTDSVWTKIIDANPYAIIHNSPFAPQCRDKTGCEIPVVRVDWFVAAASKAPLYHDVLQLPATLDGLAKKLGIDLVRRIEEERVHRAGFARSGVSQNNRLIERHDSPYGAMWVSYDFAGNTGRKNLFSYPLGPGSDESSFKHDGGEIIFNLPNGLQGYMLVNADGNRLDKGPTEIVTDDKRPDRTVVNGVSCMSCHYNGIITKADEIRPHVEANRDVFPEASRIFALYPPRDEMIELQESDALRFQQAVEQAGITLITESGEPVVNMARRFESNLDLALVSAELGLLQEEFIERLNLPQNRTLARQLGAIQVEGGTIKREVFVDVYPAAATAFGIGTPASNGQDDAEADTLVAENSPASGDGVTDDSEFPPDLPADTGPVGSPERPRRRRPVRRRVARPDPKTNPNVRTWTPIDGKREPFLAEFYGMDNRQSGIVRLKKTNGIVVSGPLNMLSQDDQKYVEGLLAKERKSESAP